MNSISIALLAAEDRALLSNGKARISVHAEEVVAFCPGCKAMQTLWVERNRLVPTRRFRQLRDDVYHDCGSSKPCRLYHYF